MPFRVAAGLLIIVLLGIALRGAQYAHNRELWEDEAAVANASYETYPILIEYFLELVHFQHLLNQLFLFQVNYFLTSNLML